MYRLWLLLAVSLCLGAEDRWVEYRSGPFQVIANVGERSGKETLGRFEQFRWALGKSLGHEDLKSTWPIRIIVFKKQGEASPLRLARDTFAAGLAAGAPIPPGVLRECAKILIEANTGRLPQPIESGLEDLFSTLESKGASVTLGAPPEPERRNRDWARMHLLSTNPDYYGKMPVFIHNLEQGTEADVACRNAFGKTPQEIDRLAAAYLAAGQFPTAPVSGKAINAERDFTGRPVEPEAAALAAADVAFTREAYEAVLAKFPDSLGAHEGLGFVALQANRAADARQEFTTAIERNSPNARAWFEYALLQNLDIAKALMALDKAALLNPNWAEPWFLMAERAAASQSKIKFLKTATRLDSRNAGYWKALAEADLAAKDYSDAAKAWAGAERASVDEAERAQIVKARQDIDQQRLDHEADRRKRDAEEKERDLQNVKNAAMERIHAAEAKANQALNEGKPPMKSAPVAWDGIEPKGKLQGALLRVECSGAKAVLIIEGDNRKLIRLLVPDVSQLLVQGASEPVLECGEQSPARQVKVQYFPKPDKATASIGEAVRIEAAAGTK